MRGEGVSVCIVDSGVDASHPKVRGVERSVVVVSDEDQLSIEDDADGDAYGHGTACAGIVRSIAPACELYSVRVLGPGLGRGRELLAGLRWAIDQGYDIVSLSLSTTRRQFAAELHELADRAYFSRSALVASAHNMPVESYPWRFSSVISVASHGGVDPFEFYYNPNPPAEFQARGVDLEVAWANGSVARTSGNSFATPHIAGLAALILSKHRGLTPFELKSVLRMTATNVQGSSIPA